MEDLKTEKKRGRDESDSADSYSADVKRLRENLLDGSDDEAELCAGIEDLDSFIKSFEEEISGEPAEVVDLTSDSGESRADLGYLFEATDDELGIPPTTSPSPVEPGIELDRLGSSGEFLEVPVDESFGFGLGDGEYLGLDELFEYSGPGFGPCDFEYRYGTLPAQ